MQNDQLLSTTKLPCLWFLDHVSQSICCLLKQSTLPLDSAAGKEDLPFPSGNFPQCLLTGKQNSLSVRAVFKYGKAIMASPFTHLSQTVLSHFSDPPTVLTQRDAGWVLAEWNAIRLIQLTLGPLLPFPFPQASAVFFYWVGWWENS